MMENMSWITKCLTKQSQSKIFSTFGDVEHVASITMPGIETVYGTERSPTKRNKFLVQNITRINKHTRSIVHQGANNTVVNYYKLIMIKNRF